MAETKVEVSLDVVSVLKYSAYAVWIAGVIYTIIATVDGKGTGAAASFFLGILWTLLAGGTLYGLSRIVELVEATEGDKADKGTEAPDQSSQFSV
jgi:hypothetical protein